MPVMLFCLLLSANLMLGPDYYGYGYGFAVALAVVVLISMLALSWTLEELGYETFMLQ